MIRAVKYFFKAHSWLIRGQFTGAKGRGCFWHENKVLGYFWEGDDLTFLEVQRGHLQGGQGQASQFAPEVPKACCTFKPRAEFNPSTWGEKVGGSL